MRRLHLPPFSLSRNSLAGLEERHPFLFDFHRFARSRVAAGARRAVLHRKGAETSKFDAVPVGERVGDLLENGADDVLDISRETDADCVTR